MSEIERGISPTIPDLAPLTTRCRAALVIRHAERYGGEVATNQDGLTPRGGSAARQLGTRLKVLGPLRFFASPVPRCVDTAKLISEGAGGQEEVVTSELLGNPGPFVIDMPEVDRNLAVLGLKGFALRWLSEGISPKVMRPCGEGSSMLLRWIASNIASEEQGLDVYVGHDLFLTPVLIHYAGYDLKSNGLLSFLDGFCLIEEDQNLKLYYKGRSIFLDGCK